MKEKAANAPADGVCFNTVHKAREDSNISQPVNYQQNFNQPHSLLHRHCFNNIKGVLSHSLGLLSIYGMLTGSILHRLHIQSDTLASTMSPIRIHREQSVSTCDFSSDSTDAYPGTRKSERAIYPFILCHQMQLPLAHRAGLKGGLQVA